ncbi:hypothetical protein LCGC14_1353320 [marine sediment metagenome]|uniref:Uncharacterized protein n=1 Tax=marine sediment metagenome TaxID=412755 RepID=A0A0F9KWD5_9ZZZZ|nr:hypothetical protein [Candidatus Aminicenantes bacterium]
MKYLKWLWNRNKTLKKISNYEKRIWFLEKKVKDYYMANYEAKKSIGINPGICCVSVLVSDEESLIVHDAETMKSIIDDLPLWDCGVG